MNPKDLVYELSRLEVDVHNSTDLQLVDDILNNMFDIQGLRHFISKVVQENIVGFNSPDGVTLIFNSVSDRHTAHRLEAIKYFLDQRYPKASDINDLLRMLIEFFKDEPSQEELDKLQMVLCSFFKISLKVPQGSA